MNPAAGVATEAALAQAVALGLLLCARMAPLAWLVPWLSDRGGSAVLRISATLVLALCAWPVAAASAAALPLAPLSLLALALREALIGVLSALALGLPLHALEWAGSLSGGLLGGARAAAPYALLYRAVAVAAFFALGGARVSLRAIVDGVSRHPIGVLTDWSGPGALALSSARLCADALATAVLIALPVAAALLLTELALALTARLSSAAALLAGVVPARLAIGLFVVCLTLLWWLSAAGNLLDAWFGRLKDLGL